MANRLQGAAVDLLRTAGYVQQPDGSWKPTVTDAPEPETASPREVATLLGTSVDGLAQMRYRRTGPAYIKVGPRKVIYRWADVRAFLDANTIQRGSRCQGAAAVGAPAASQRD